MRILDLFCGGGGIARGLIRAGWHVTGVDKASRFRSYYPSRFIMGDALEWLAAHGMTFDAIHASPPCQGYTRGNAGRVTPWPKLIPEVRAALEAVGRPWSIENVRDARPDMRDPVTLCGCMFGLTAVDTDGVRLHMHRPRLFETSWGMVPPRPCDHAGHRWIAGAYGGARRDKYEAKYVRKGGYVPPDKQVVARLMGLPPTLSWQALFEAVPPAYGHWLGLELAREIGAAP